MLRFLKVTSGYVIYQNSRNAGGNADRLPRPLDYSGTDGIKFD